MSVNERYEELGRKLRGGGLTKPRIVVLGVGGAGCNAVNNMIKKEVGSGDVTFVACNTDQQALEKCEKHAIHIQVGPKTTRGLGAGADPKKGEEAALESMEEIADTFADAHMLFITAGAGGGTGGGGAPEIAKAARERGILTIGFITRPFVFEGRARSKAAQASIDKLQENVDCLIIVQNQNLLEMNNAALPVLEGFAKVDEVLCSGVAGIVNIIARHGVVNVDFQDALKVMKNRMSRVVFGVGVSAGDDAGSKAAAIALSNPLLELDENTLKKVDTALVSVTGGPGLSLQAVEGAVEYLRSQINAEEDNLIVGMAVIPDMKADDVEVCIFASCPKDVEDQPELNNSTSDSIKSILNRAEKFVTVQEPESKVNKDSKDSKDYEKLADEYIGKPHLNLQESASALYEGKKGSKAEGKKADNKTSTSGNTKHASFFNKLLGTGKWFGK